jgi:SAM-dependent methyltransferase
MEGAGIEPAVERHTTHGLQVRTPVLVSSGDCPIVRQVQALTFQGWLRWDIVVRLLPTDASTVLEIGAGLGSMGAMLAERFSYVGLEPDPRSQAEANVRTGGKVVCERAEDHLGVYDLVCAFEVLEHIDDDVAALAAWRERSRNWLLLSVPMNPDRFGAWDELAGHFRRYTAGTLSSALADGGWKPKAIHAYGFPLGYALNRIQHKVAARQTKGETMIERTDASGRGPLRPPQSMRYVTWAGALPFRVLQRPFADSKLGTGLIALATKS